MGYCNRGVIQMGQEAFKSIVKSHYKNVAAVLFIYSVEKRESYDKLGAMYQSKRL